VEEGRQIVDLFGGEEAAVGRHVGFGPVEDADGDGGAVQAVAHVGQVQPAGAAVAADRVAIRAAVRVPRQCAALDGAPGRRPPSSIADGGRRSG